MTFDLGIDAGGSKSGWAVLDAHGAVAHRGLGPAIQAAALDPTIVAARLREVVAAAADAAGARPASLVAGLAGAGHPTVRAAIRSALEFSIPTAIVGDVEAAAAACLRDAPGVAVWAGTGSFAVARDAGGRLHRAGGRGWLLDDRGGAFAIVRAAAVAVVEAADGVGRPTALTGVLCRAFGLRSAHQLGGVLQRERPGDVAAAAREVIATADDGDEVADRVLRVEAGALADRASAAVRRAGLDVATAAVAFGGGILSSSPRSVRRLADALCDRGFGRAPIPGEVAAVGAARLAHALRTGAAPLRDWVDDERAA